MPKSEFDVLVAETGGNLAQIETKLGLNAGDTQGCNSFKLEELAVLLQTVKLVL
ncbi:MAG: hypothetical protein RJQ14_04115 [Marinoscillum sp.]